MLKKWFINPISCMLLIIVFLSNTSFICFGAEDSSEKWLQGVYNKQETGVAQVASLKCQSFDGNVSGDMAGTYNFTELEFITIMTGELRFNGIVKGKWNAVLDGTQYSGSVKGTFYSDSLKQNVYAKCIISGEKAEGLMECSLSSDAITGRFNGGYSGKCILTRLNDKKTQLALNVTGKFGFKEISERKNTKISFSQSAFIGKTEKGLDIYPIVTSVIIADENSPYNNEGFSNISYSSSIGSGTAWSYSSMSDTGMISMDGIIRGDLSGVISGKIDFSNIVWRMSLIIYESKLDSVDKPILNMNLWGPLSASRGQLGYINIQCSNTGNYFADNVTVVLDVPSGVELTDVSPGGSYDKDKRKVTWKIGRLDKHSYRYMYVRVKIMSTATFNASLYAGAMNYLCCKAVWTISEVLVPHDPNAKYGPSGPYTPGEELKYKVEFENEGKGEAFGVFFTDTLDEDLDDATLVIGPVYSTKDNSRIAPEGVYNPQTRTITWFAGDVKSKEGGYAEYTIKVNKDAEEGSEIFNYATVYFPNADEETRTNPVIGYIKDSTPPKLDISPRGGTYNSAQSIKIDSSEIADIYYTTDNSKPDENSKKYEGPVTLDKDTVLKFIGIDYFGNKSKVYSETYNIKLHTNNTSSNNISSYTPASSPTQTATAVVTPAPTEVVEPKPSVPAAAPFKDISGHWAENDILNLYDKGIVTGYPDKTIRPDVDINRAEVVVMIIKALGIEPEQNLKSGFSDDKNIPEWAKGYIIAAKKMNVVLGFEDNSFKPLEKCTREQLTAIIVRAFNFRSNDNKKLNFTDEKDIGKWAVDYIKTASSLDLITGYEDNSFRPKIFTKRSEVMVVLNRCMDKQ